MDEVDGKTIDSRIKKKHQHVSFGSEKNYFCSVHLGNSPQTA